MYKVYIRYTKIRFDKTVDDESFQPRLPDTRDKKSCFPSQLHRYADEKKISNGYSRITENVHGDDNEIPHDQDESHHAMV